MDCMTTAMLVNQSLLMFSVLLQYLVIFLGECMSGHGCVVLMIYVQQSDKHSLALGGKQRSEGLCSFC